jgi:hypothetical protein
MAATAHITRESTSNEYLQRTELFLNSFIVSCLGPALTTLTLQFMGNHNIKLYKQNSHTTEYSNRSFSISEEFQCVNVQGKGSQARVRNM